MSTKYVLRAPDGRLVTNDTQNGASLTKNSALCYVWDCKEKAESERVVYQAILGASLSVEIHVRTSMLRP
jgi:hypothetical protein